MTWLGKCFVEVRLDGCWLWIGYIDRDGYGKISLGPGATGLAHRESYDFHVGPIPAGLELDHLCRNRACVNPAHLEPVTHAENMRRSAAARKTHCKRGHEFSPENTYRRPNGGRDCRACIRERSHNYRRRQAA